MVGTNFIGSPDLMMPNEVKSPQGKIKISLDMQGVMISELNDVVNYLSEKLVPVLAISDNKESKGFQPNASNVPIIGTIESNTYGIYLAMSNLKDLSNRCEL